MARRRRHVERVLGPSNRSNWVATGAILCGGALLMAWFAAPTDWNRQEKLAALDPGDPIERVADALGPPRVRCPVRDLSFLAESFPSGWSSERADSTLEVLTRATAERWVYPLRRGRRVTCAPADGRTEIGVDALGRMLWYVTVTGESPLRFGGL